MGGRLQPRRWRRRSRPPPAERARRKPWPLRPGSAVGGGLQACERGGRRASASAAPEGKSSADAKWRLAASFPPGCAARGGGGRAVEDLYCAPRGVKWGADPLWRAAGKVGRPSARRLPPAGRGARRAAGGRCLSLSKRFLPARQKGTAKQRARRHLRVAERIPGPRPPAFLFFMCIHSFSSFSWRTRALQARAIYFTTDRRARGRRFLGSYPPQKPPPGE